MEINRAIGQMAAGVPVGQGIAGMAEAAQGEGGGDLFGQLLDILLGNQQEMQQLFAQMGQAQEDGEKKGTDLASQMMAELFYSAAPAAMWDQLPQQPEAAAELLVSAQAAGSLPAVSQELLSQLIGQAEGGSPAGVDWNQLVQQLRASSAQGENETAQAVEGQPLPVTAAEQTGSKEQTGDFLQGQTQFLGSVTAAKRELSAGAQKEEKNGTQPLDLDQLQQWVDNKRYLPETHAVGGSVRDPQAAELIEQVQTGIKANLAEGKNEFVVKLQPEGMGSITVKMVENEGKITLSILASNSQVAKALNSGLVELQESLKPYHTEVQQVVAETTAAWQGDASTTQDFGGQQHQQFQNQPHRSNLFFEQEETEDFNVQPLPAGALSSELDAYI